MFIILQLFPSVNRLVELLSTFTKHVQFAGGILYNMFENIQRKEVYSLAKLSERIKMLRTTAGMTQEEFGKIFGIVKSTVSLYESGKSCPNDQIKLKICEYFNVPMDFLIGLSNVTTISGSNFGKVLTSDGVCHSHFVDLCEIRKKTTEELSNITGISIDALNSWFVNEIPTLENIVMVADALNTTVDYLIGRTDLYNEISPEKYEILSYYSQLSKIDQRWIVGQMADLIKNKPSIPTVAAVSEKKASGK